MKAETFYLSSEQTQNLEDLGVKIKDALFYYRRSSCEKGITYPRPWMRCDITHDGCFIPTLTEPELREMLPRYIDSDNTEESFSLMLEYNGDDNKYLSYYDAYKLGTLEHNYIEGETAIECLYKMLCWLAEMKYLSNE